jgi:tetratricopeptide (TPR) repeat protein
MARMGHDSERAALIYQHEARGADKRITEAINLYLQAERSQGNDDDGAAGTLGPGHPKTWTARSDLAATYRAAGHTGAAIALFEQVLADHERVLGPDHLDTWTARGDLAEAYRAAGRAGEAGELDPFPSDP